MPIAFLANGLLRTPTTAEFAALEDKRRIKFVWLNHAVAFLACAVTGTLTGLEVVAFHFRMTRDDASCFMVLPALKTSFLFLRKISLNRCQRDRQSIKIQTVPVTLIMFPLDQSSWFMVSPVSVAVSLPGPACNHHMPGPLRTTAARSWRRWLTRIGNGRCSGVRSCDPVSTIATGAMDRLLGQFCYSRR